MLTGNKGEWSEVYAFCYLLKKGILQTADKDLNATSFYYPILKIIREGKFGKDLDYYPDASGCSFIKIYDGESPIGEISACDMQNAVDIMLDKIPCGEKAFTIPELDSFFDELQVTKLKADSLHKRDINIEIDDIKAGRSAECGFSIKSYLGAKPTLINPGKSTNFIYNISGCTDDIMRDANAINSKTKIIDRIRFLTNSGCRIFSTFELTSRQFKENLEFVDSRMPEMLSEVLLAAYLKGAKGLSAAVNLIKADNPLHFSNPNMYEYKMKKLLCACALGMTPEKHWEGAEDANGGYIVVKRDGSVLCYHIYNRNDFEQYLYDYTCFDSPSTTRYDYMTVYKEGDDYKIKFNLQVRFI